MNQNRRKFLNTALCAGAGLMVNGRPFTASGAVRPRPRHQDRELLDKTIVIDGLAYLHFDPLSEEPVGAQLFREIADSGATAINYSLNADNFEETVRTIARWTRVIDQHPDKLIKALSAADIERAESEGKLAVLIGFQDPAPIGTELDRLELFYDLGLRIIQLTENFQNHIGSGCNERRDGGLTRFGIDFIRRMNEMGILVDVSHCGPTTSLDAIEASEKPIAVTHSNCAAVHQTPRAKSDEVIQALAKRGGVMGITFLNFFVSPKPQSSVDDVVDHIDHVRKVAGIDHVGIGSDLPIGSFLRVFPDESTFLAALADYIAASGSDYIRWPATIEGLDGPQKYPAIARALQERGYSETEIRKVMGLNFLRVLRASLE